MQDGLQDNNLQLTEEEQSIFQVKVGLLIQRIKNAPIDSNCFVIYSNLNSDCIIVDPGTENCNELLFFLKTNDLVPENIILTHEHFDHVWGVNKLLELFACTVICSQKCLDHIADKKKNLSIFHDQIGFDIFPVKVRLVYNETLKLCTHTIQFKETLGHSLGSISFWINESLFVGDVLIKDIKSVTKLPGGSRIQLKNTIIELKELFGKKKMIVYPGHGEVFPFNEIDYSKVI